MQALSCRMGQDINCDKIEAYVASYMQGVGLRENIGNKAGLRRAPEKNLLFCGVLSAISHVFKACQTKIGLYRREP